MSVPERSGDKASMLLVAVIVLGAGAAWIGLVLQRAGREPGWAGVDEAVIGRFAEAAGRPAEPSFAIDWVQGDLLLFAFLCAGLIAGGLLGFYARALFVEHRDASAPAASTRSGEHS